MNTPLARQAGLPDSRAWPSDHSVSNHLASRRRRFVTLPLSATAAPIYRRQTSPQVCRLVRMSGRIEFVILRTGHSPPAAPHPASGRRSCIQFQAGERLPEEDFHLSDLARSQAHIPPASAVWFINFNLTSHDRSFDTAGFSRVEFQLQAISLENRVGG